MSRYDKYAKNMARDNLYNKLETTASYMIWFNRFAEIAMSRFEWTTESGAPLPDNIPERFIEQSMFRTGAVFIGYDKTGELMFASRANSRAKPNFYGDPYIFQCYGLNGTQFVGYTLEPENPEHNNVGVMVWNNYQRLPSYGTVREYAMRMALIERVMDVNVNGQKTPRIMKGTQKQINTLKNIAMDVDSFSAALMVDDSLDNDAFNVFATPAPYVADKLQDLKRQIWADGLDALGVGQPPYKRERQNESEIATYLQSAQATLYSSLACREEGCRRFNDMIDKLGLPYEHIICTYRDIGVQTTEFPADQMDSPTDHREEQTAEPFIFNLGKKPDNE